MSEGATATDAASNASNASTAVDAAGTAATSTGTVADAAGNVSNVSYEVPGGWGVDTQNSIGAANSNLATYGNTSPSWLDNTMNTYDRFSKGGDMSLPKAYETYQKGGFGNNPETYGYIYSKLGQFAKGGGGGQPMQPASINVNYQQPDNPYLRRRGY